MYVIYYLLNEHKIESKSPHFYDIKMPQKQVDWRRRMLQKLPWTACTHRRIWHDELGNIFRVAGLLWGESTGHQWIPFTKACDTELTLTSICAWTNGWKKSTPVIWDVVALNITSVWWWISNTSESSYSDGTEPLTRTLYFPYLVAFYDNDLGLWLTRM